MKIKKAQRKKDENPWHYTVGLTGARADVDFKFSIIVSNIDGSFFMLPSCYLEEDDGFIFVLEEHHGHFCFEKEIINHWDYWEN